MRKILKMRPGWQSATLQDLVFFQRGYDITKAEQKPGDIPVVSSSGINSYHSESKVEGPGVVIGRKGSLGTVHYIEGSYWPHDTTLWSKDLKGNYARFIYYFLFTLDLKHYDVGNANPTLNRNHIHGLKIRMPKYQIQKKISAILSTYDDLIENNRRRIQLLEQAARLLYKEWFVHLRFPGHEHAKIKNGAVDMETLLKGVCNKRNFMDLVENFILFDESSGEPKKILARNHQFLGVNLAIESVRERKERKGRMGVFWHTQGAGKSYSMVMFTRKVHRKIGGNFTFLVLTDRDDLDRQIYKTFAGCGVVDHDRDPCRASSGEHLSRLLAEHKSHIFSLIQKFNQDVEG